MDLDGVHHVTMITGDAQRTLDFYSGILGLRLVKRTVNFDSPQNYHLYLGDEVGSPGSLLTWFERPGIEPGRAGASMVHTIQLGVATPESVEFWDERLTRHDHQCDRHGDALLFRDPDGLSLEIVVAEQSNPMLRARHPEIPAEHALMGVEGARAYGREESVERVDDHLLTNVLGFVPAGAPGAYTLRGPTRGFNWAYDTSPGTGILGAGSVHHIAWHCADADQAKWRGRVHDAGMRVTEILDRDYFRSIYFREPQGILFELATTSPGFAIDEDPDHLGESLRLPAQHEHLRARLEQTLRPLTLPTLQRPKGAA